jgi:DNA polymerase III delta prime subunit
VIYEQAFQLAAHILAQTPKNPYGFPLESTTKFLAQNTHPNFFLLTPSEPGKDILIENARDLTVFLQKTPAIPGWRVIIINPADRLNNAAANALLKSIEEMPAQTTIFLIAGGLARMKATILSRSQKIFFPTRRYSTEDYIRLFSQPSGAGIGAGAKSLEPKAIIAAIDKALHEHKIDKQCVEAIIANDGTVALFKKIVLAHLYELAHKLADKKSLYVTKYNQISNFISSAENKSLPQSFIVNIIFFKLQ